MRVSSYTYYVNSAGSKIINFNKLYCSSSKPTWTLLDKLIDKHSQKLIPGTAYYSNYPNCYNWLPSVCSATIPK